MLTRTGGPARCFDHYQGCTWPVLLVLGTVLMSAPTAPVESQDCGAEPCGQTRPTRVIAATDDATEPRIGNLTYEEDEVWQPVATLSPDQRRKGYTRSFVVGGYLCLIWAPDLGGPTTRGGIDVWDISDPRNPVLVKEWLNEDTVGLPQQHDLGLWNRDGQIVLATVGPSNSVMFFDVTDIGTELTLLSTITLSAIGGSYNNVRSVTVQAPYVYAVARGNGLYVLDATDPTAPELVTTVPSGKLGGISPTSVHAVGNLLMVSDVFGYGHATVDISDPEDPVLIRTIEGASGYSHLFSAGLLMTPGGLLNSNRMFVHRVDHDGSMHYAGEAGEELGEGGYGSYQDGYFFGGFGNQVAKFTIDPPALVGAGTSGIEKRDEDFADPLGNLILASNDHGKGTALIPHQAEPDTTGADVVWMHPPGGATGLSLTTRVGFSMSDSVAVESLTADNFSLRARGDDALAGQLSVNQNNVNFSPDEPLAASTTYDVRVCGIEDIVGNAGGCTTWEFTTKNTEAQSGAPGCRLDRFTPIQTGVSTTYAPTATENDPTAYTWRFGTGFTVGPQATAEATATYTEPGRYSVILTVANTHGTSQCSAVQIVHTPIAALSPLSSSSIITTETSDYFGFGVFRNVTDIYTANPDNDTVTRIHQDNAKLWEVAVGDTPRTLAEAPDGHIWVANQGSNDITVLTRSGDFVQTIELDHGSAPYGIVFAPDGSAAYVTLEAAGRLLKLGLDGTIEDDLAIGARPRALAVSGDSKRIFVTRFVSAFAETRAVGEIYEVDVGSFTVARTIELASSPGPDTESKGRGVPNYLAQVRIAPDGATAWVPSKQDNIARGRFRDGLDLDFETQTRAIVSRIDLTRNAEALGRRTDFNDRSLAQSMVFTPLGDAFFVALLGSNVVEVWDAYDRGLLGAVPVGRAPVGLTLNASGRRLYVHNYLDRSVTVVNIAGVLDGTLNQPLPVTTVATVAEETLAPEVLRGKRIFYNAADARMNQDGYISCASCHLDGGSDGMVWDRTQFGEGLRNTIDLRGRRGTDGGLVHWTSNFDEIQDFEHDIRDSFGGLGFMSDSDFETGTRAEPLGAAKEGFSAELDDLAAYVSSLNEYPDSPHRGENGELTETGQAGKLVFAQMGCSVCHAGTDFTDEKIHDVCTVDASSGQGSGAPLAGINTPTLKGLWQSAPYLHNGSLGTLSEVLDGAEHMGGALTEQEKADLKAYLLQIDGSSSGTGGDGGEGGDGGDDGGRFCPPPPTDGGGGGGGGAPPPSNDDDDDGGDNDGGGDRPPPPPPPSGPPKADFTLTAECVEGFCRARTGLPVTFEDTSTGRVQSRLWDFGDATRSRNQRIDYAWSSPGFYEVTLSVTDGTTTSTASQKLLVEAAAPLGTCQADAETLCLQDSRYAVGVDWLTADGRRGAASVVHSGTNDAGMFWFFNRENWEVLIKVLDGCAVNGYVWVYGASTTDLGYRVRVTDTATGTVKEYRNEPGLPAPAIIDATAFSQGCRR